MQRLTRPRHPLLLAALAVALSLPALGLGFQLDDHYLRLALSRPPQDPAWARPPGDVFAFFRGDPAFTRQAREHASVPWWADERLQLAFWRPLSGLTHGLDFALWPRSPALMHAHSLLWLGACVAAAAALFGRLGLAPAVAGLAGLLFALDDGHGTPAAWIANRNALVASFFGLLCLLAHHRWRAEGWRPGALLAPLCLALGLLGGEMAVATGGYLLAHALFLERGPWRARLASLAPGALVGLGWALLYRAQGYGTRHSVLYVDPLGSPLEFAGALLERGPILFFGQFALPADLHGALSPAGRQAFWLAACALLVAVGALLWPLLRADRVARFLAAGLLLSLVPAAATFPSSRLLVMASLGGAGLVAQWLVRAWAGPARGLTRVAAWAAVALHLVLAPLGLLGAASGVDLLGQVPTRAAATLPSEPALSRQHLLLVNTPSAFLSAQSLLERGLSGGPTPARAHVLASGLGALRLSRPDARSLELRPEGGWLAPPGSVSRNGDPSPPAFDQHHVLAIFDRLYRGPDGFATGQRLALGGLEVVIRALTADGRPAEALFVFERPLEDPLHRWLQWHAGGYQPFAPPPVGASVELPPPAVWPGD